MTIPTRAEPCNADIQSASDKGTSYQAILQDGTILWIPKDPANNDCTELEAWAVESNIEL